MVTDSLEAKNEQNAVLRAECGKDDGGMATGDTGCNRAVGGEDSHEEKRLALKRYGLKPISYQKVEEFIFGNNQTEFSDRAFIYPCGFDGKFASGVDIARIKPKCPTLLSKGILKSWEANLNFGKQESTLDRFHHKAPFVNGVPMFDLFDFGPPETFDRSKVPPAFWDDGDYNDISYDKYLTMFAVTTGAIPVAPDDLDDTVGEILYGDAVDENWSTGTGPVARILQDLHRRMRSWAPRAAAHPIIAQDVQRAFLQGDAQVRA